MQIRVKTAAAQYMISRPASGYRKLFAHLTEQGDIAVEVQRALLPSLGGSAGASFDEVIARMARAKVRCPLWDMPAYPSHFLSICSCHALLFGTPLMPVSGTSLLSDQAVYCDVSISLFVSYLLPFPDSNALTSWCRLGSHTQVPERPCG